MSKDAAHQFHSAPEVAEGSGADGLIPAHDAMAELPRSMHQYQAIGQQQSPPSFQHDPQYSSAHEHRDSKLAGVDATDPAYSRSTAGGRKRWTWMLIAGILLALAIGLGVGVGVGLSQKSSDPTENASKGGINEATATTSTASTATPTATAVTSGSTGLAEFSCNSTQTTTSSDGTPYVQECFTQYQSGHPSYYSGTNNVTMTNLGGKITVYTFRNCLDQCEERNAAGEQPPCRAVTYYANLTVPIQRWGGNCFLKNDRGYGYQTDTIDYSHTASAYQSCLNSTCFAGHA